MHDFGISATPMALTAGLVTLHIENSGPSTHELILDRSVVSSESLPLLPNTLQVNEAGSQLTPVASLDDIAVFSSHDLTVQLAPGFYVLFCNLDGHYLGGMQSSLVVKE